MAEILPAWLLIGPTGSGKSPLGEALAERHGWVHLDFGAWLRACDAGKGAKDLSGEERIFLQRLLHDNALFTGADFPLVRRLVLAFLAQRPASRGVILNGLPRHRTQAEQIAELFEVQAVVVLHCTPGTVFNRVMRRRLGGGEDHAGRGDDSVEDVSRKLEIFEAETFPLVAYFRQRGVPVIERRVEDSTTASALAVDVGNALYSSEDENHVPFPQ